MVSDEIPVLVMQKFGLEAKRQGNEYHSPCPDCAGKDRCIWFNDETKNGFCRQCMKTFWLTDLEKIDPLEKLDRQKRAREREVQELAMIERRITDWQRRADYRAGFHDGMSYAAREWWMGQGITDESIDWYGLGMCKWSWNNNADGEQRKVTAYTIPIRDPQTWEVVNMQYRLENPPPGVGKYLQSQGLPARSFYARQHTGGDVLIVEGAKKAIVLDQFTDRTIQIVGLPGITPSDRLIDELAGYKRKWLLPDPDVLEKPVQRFREHLTDLRVVRLPVKPDDAVLQRGMGKDELRNFMRYAR